VVVLAVDQEALPLVGMRERERVVLAAVAVVVEANLEG
jgi:hypothetical protein